MKKFAGVAQPLERRGASHPEVAGSNPAPRSIKQAFAAGLYMNQADRKLGFEDGLADFWRLSAEEIVEDAGGGGRIDVLAYASGFNDGLRLRLRRNGG